GTYAGWNGHESLPVLDYANPAVCDAIFDGDDSLLRRWLRPPWSIDGWRLDVVHMLGEGAGAGNNAALVRRLRDAVKTDRPDAWVLGEHFSEATRWLQGDQEDGAMNYFGFAQPVRAWLAGLDVSYHPIRIDARECARWLTEARARIPYENQLAQLNLLDSHDTARMFTLLGARTDRMKLAVAMLFTYPGVPSTYYGDEIGLEGGRDPDCRRCFDWDPSHWNRALFDGYRRFARLRRDRVELRRGAFHVLAAHGETLAWARFTDDRATLVVINAGVAPSRVTLPVWQLPTEIALWARIDSTETHFPRPDGTLELTVEPCGVIAFCGQEHR
ncbi:MAG: alpha-amylase family glycosyl hydrolase, partial [Deltaproteobacteria bacterium]